MRVVLIAQADLPEEADAEIANKIDKTGQERTRRAAAAVRHAYLSGARASGDPLPLIPSQPSWQLLAA